jgi:hypothetical protein
MWAGSPNFFKSAALVSALVRTFVTCATASAQVIFGIASVSLRNHSNKLINGLGAPARKVKPAPHGGRLDRIERHLRLAEKRTRSSSAVMRRSPSRRSFLLAALTLRRSARKVASAPLFRNLGTSPMAKKTNGQGAQDEAMKIEMWPLDRIKPYSSNPRKKTDSAVEKGLNQAIWF